MQDTTSLFFSMAGIEGTCYLSDCLPYLLFRDVFLLFLEPFDQLCHIAPLAVLHHDVDLGLLFIDYAIVIADNIRMMKFTEDVDLADQLLLFLFIHLAIVEFLPDEDAAIGLSTNLTDHTERALAYVGDLLVILHDF